MSRFNYIAFDLVSNQKQEGFKRMFEMIEAFAAEHLPESRERSLLVTGLEQAYMWTGKAIRNEQLAREGNPNA